MKMRSLFLKIFIAAIFFLACALMFHGYAQADEIDDLCSGCWTQIGSNNLNSVGVRPSPVPSGPNGNCGNCGNVNAFSGGFYDSLRQRYLVMGGGHGDYAGNEVYAFALTSNDATHTKFSWKRIWGPTPNAQITNFGGVQVRTYLDGNPASRHLYSGEIYVANIDRYMIWGGSIWPGGGFQNDAWLLNPALGSGTNWTEAADMSAATPGSCGAGGSGAPYSVYDPSTGKVYVHNSDRLCQWDTAGNTWLRRGGSGASFGTGGNLTAVFDQLRKQFCFIGIGANSSTGGNGVSCYDMSSPTNNNISITNLTSLTSGPKDVENANSPGCDYDTVISKIVCWIGGTSVYTLDLTTKVWTSVSPGAGNSAIPDAVHVNGTHTRFRYYPQRNVYVLLNSAANTVNVYKLAAGQAQISLPTGQWFKQTLSATDQNKFPFTGGIKHQMVMYNSNDGLMYMFGGDHAAPVPMDPRALNSGADSGRNEMFRYNIATNSLEAIQHYCPVGNVAARQDEVGIAYDSLRQQFWMFPGFQYSNTADTGGNPTCPGDYVHINGVIMTWKPSTFSSPSVSNWTNPSIALSGQGTQGNWNQYDPVTDTFIRIIQSSGCGPEAQVLNPNTGQWTRYNAGGDWANGVPNCDSNPYNDTSTAIDVAGRRIYAIATGHNTDPARPSTFIAFNIDTHTFIGSYNGGLLPPPPENWRGPPLGVNGTEQRIVWDSVNNVLIWSAFTDLECSGLAGCQESVRLYAYTPGTNTWSGNLVPSGTTPDGTRVKGRQVAFNPQQNALMVYGVEDNNPVPTNIFLFRYGQSSGGDAIQPTVAITSPTSGPTWPVSAVTTTINLAGTASDNTAVTSITCQNSAGGTCTVGGTLTSWTITGLALQLGDNPIIVTAFDAAGNSSSDTITVTRAATTYWSSPAGGAASCAAASGTSDPGVYRTLAQGIACTAGGDTLKLKNGTYTGAGTILAVDTKSGSAGFPITITAQNPGQAFILGNGTAGQVVRLANANYWIVEGLRVENVDNVAYTGSSAQVFYLFNASNNIIRKNIIKHPNRWGNNGALTIQGDGNLIEDNDVLFFHRNGIEVYPNSSDANIIRRNYVGQTATNLAASGQPNDGYVAYDAILNVWENNIFEGLGASSSGGGEGFTAWGAGNKYYGNICIGAKNNCMSLVSAASITTGASGYIVRDFLAMNMVQFGLFLRSPIGADVQGYTAHTSTLPNRGFIANNADAVGTTSFTLRNAMLVDTSGAFASPITTVTISHSQEWGAASSWSTGTSGRTNSPPTVPGDVDPVFGSCRTHLPAASPFKSVGFGGADIAATAIYEYVAGIRTSGRMFDNLLASADRGKAMYGPVVVAGVNDSSTGLVRSTVHLRLGFGDGTCAFPSGYGGALSPGQAMTGRVGAGRTVNVGAGRTFSVGTQP
jgi:hypothetical protein